MSKPIYIVALDQGTTSSRAMVFDPDGTPLHSVQREFPQIYPLDGWVEHDPEVLWQTSLTVVQLAYEWALSKGALVCGLGITNQRETTVVWDKKTGEPVYNAIVWQDRRTADQCLILKQRFPESVLQAKTGLLMDPYFSATKIAWILDNVAGARSRAERGELAFGTIDTFLIWRFTRGKRFVTDITNASRTNLYNINTLDWDSELLKLFNVPGSILPEVLDNTAKFGVTDKTVLGHSIAILGVAGDQQAAAIGQGCFTQGSVKSTYGTGCFLLVNTGQNKLTSKHRLLSTIAYRLQGQTHYALEGSIFVAGAAVQWLRDGISIIQSSSESEALASTLESNHNVYFVPALTGLGAPHWNPDARGAIFGLSRSTGPEHLARAALESVCYQTHDLILAMKNDGIEVKCMRIDGGMAANNWFSQHLSNILGITVDRPSVIETTALGAAFLVALHLKFYESPQALMQNWAHACRFKPTMDDDTRLQQIQGWNRAVAAVLRFAEAP